MPEEQPDLFRMPSRIRIAQRLGQISTNANLSEHLYLAISSHEKEEMTPEGMVDMLTQEIQGYAELNTMGITAPFLERIPSYINALVESDRFKARSLTYWEQVVMDRKSKDNEKEQEILDRYRRRDMPRRMKKRNNGYKKRN